MPISAAYGELVIAYDSDEVRLKQFLGGAMPRQRIGMAAVNRSALGVAFSSGPPVADRFMWPITALISTAQRATLEVIASAWDTARAAGGLPMPTLTVVDGIVATSTTEKAALLSQMPEYTRYGSQWAVSMVLMEV